MGPARHALLTRVFPDWDSDGYCDIIDVCPGRSDPAQADTDADGIGDVCDLCTGGATTTRQIVKVTNFATYDDSSPAGAFLDRGGLLAAEEGDDKITFKATLLFDAPVAPDPENNGFALMLEDATGKRLLDLRIPPGAYNAVSRSGWISSKKKPALHFPNTSRRPSAEDHSQIQTEGSQPSRCHRKGKEGRLCRPAGDPPPKSDSIPRPDRCHDRPVCRGRVPRTEAAALLSNERQWRCCHL